jgi:hypothetical protein
MDTSNDKYVPNIQDWWIGYYGKQVISNNISQQHVVDNVPSHTIDSFKKGEVEDARQTSDAQTTHTYTTDITDPDMTDAQLVSPVQGVVEQARAIKRHRKEMKNTTENAKRRRKSTNKRRRRKSKNKKNNKKSKRARKKQKSKRRPKKKSRKRRRKNKANAKRGRSRKKAKNKGKRRINKEKQRDIFN